MTNFRLRLRSLALVLAAPLGAIALVPSDASACGGCFHPENQAETTLVTAHRMAFSISTERTILWDQVQYAGSPTEFAWVLPVRAGAYIELASDAWFDALDAATSTRVVAPQIQCDFGDDGFYYGDDSSSGCGCGSLADDSAGFGGENFGSSGSGEQQTPPVTVVHEGSVGPYDTVTLHANVPGALPDWLTTNGFAIDASVQPIIDAYVAEGFDFIALRLQPGQGVQQMKPVRVVSPGATPILPLRMVSAGTGATVSLTLFVIGEGRWESQNFPNSLADVADLSWDFWTNSSNYSVLREKIFAEGGNRTWLTSYAKQGALLSPIDNPLNNQPVQYSSGSSFSNTIGEFFVEQARLNGETSDSFCTSAFQQYADSGDVVVDVCQGQGGTGGGGIGGTGGTGGAGGNCGAAGPGEIDSREFACDTLDDMAAALVGMHPRDVWLTRLDSKLLHAALNDDFTIQAAEAQTEVENWLTATQAENPPCPLAASASIATGTSVARRKTRSEFVWIGAALLAVAAAVARRRSGMPA